MIYKEGVGVIRQEGDPLDEPALQPVSEKVPEAIVETFSKHDDKKATPKEAVPERKAPRPPERSVKDMLVQEPERDEVSLSRNEEAEAETDRPAHKKKRRFGRFVLRLIGLAIILCVILGTFAAVDYIKVFSNHEKPMFAAFSTTVDDGGSGSYSLFVYRFEIEGNFLPGEEPQGGTSAKFYVLDRLIDESVR